MTPAIGIDPWWASVFLIAAVATVLGVNAVLLHASRKGNGGRFVRPLLRMAKSRARSLTNDFVHPHVGAPAAAAAARTERDVWHAARTWVRWDPNPRTRATVQRWIEERDEVSARRGLMGKRLAFGTSGLRGAMGPGFCRINDLVVIQTTQGLCRYLEKEGGEEFKARGVVIGRDHRKQGGLSSDGFARLAAAVFVSRGFRVFLMDGTVATPLVAFGVSHTKACAGVMVTASHNPKKDNGYKVYWGNGSQIIPPHDTGIATSIARNLEPWQVYDPSAAIAGPLCSDPTAAITEAYYRGIAQGLCRRPEANARSGLKMVYSAMHGVGDRWAQRAFGCFSLPPLLSVECQREPDPKFPTVAFPNPEEQGALKEAMLLAEERDVPFVIANDPDGDRLAAAERQPSGDWRIFSGNEIGTLLGLWQWEEWRRTHPDEDASNAVMIASTVSSNMLSAVARQEGFTFEETLPGFKWMGHRGQQLKAEGKTILFAYEEAIGFGPGDVVFEKDGLSSAALFAEMLVALRDRDLSHENEAATTTLPAVVATEARAVFPAPSLLSSRPPLSSPLLAPLSSSSPSTADCRKMVGPSPEAPACRKCLPGGEITKGCGAPPSNSPPSSPSTVWASPPPSPAEAVGLRSDSTVMFPPAVRPASPKEGAVPSGTSPTGAIDVEAAVTGDAPVASRADARDAELERRGGVSSVLLRRLQALHERYGEFAEENGYVRCEDKEVVSKIFARLRGDGSYRSEFGTYKVTAVRDLAEGYGFDSETADGRPTLPVVGGGAHFLTFKFAEHGVVATLRTSGTEPKIKFYMEMQGEPGVPLEEVSARLSVVADVFLEEAFQLERWGMKRVALA
ncbi:unnamed protein product [Scytosiphon promiscuus]